ncbi:MAG: adenosine-specific kinase [Thermofilum sp.]|jgi:adenosine/AMP kinase|uniref:Adenosine monophosphate-protein transferase n=3 Tax=Thermofilum adornatum TaxID=1365176 RepID=S5Z7G0_9CREN|nr:adenosine-specific kinase [Thermofilum adornatum]AGT35290.1 adenosine monophosphate-protein transferase [Thermofilum adornatum]AJB41081.1 putative transmembrane protein [Thermofilum adornatum 1505]
MSTEYKILIIDVPVPEKTNVIIGQTHFIKSVEDIAEVVATSVPNAKFGLAFNEASGDRLVRFDGNDPELVQLAIESAKRIGAGHVFVLYLRDAWPINILNQIKNVQEVAHVFCATANPVQVVVIETSQGRGVLGVVDGYTVVGVEKEEDKKKRIEFLRRIGYKRG